MKQKQNEPLNLHNFEEKMPQKLIYFFLIKAITVNIILQESCPVYIYVCIKYRLAFNECIKYVFGCICIYHPWLSTHNVKQHAYFFQLGTQRSNQLFRAEYNAITNEEAFYNGQGQSLLSVSYKSGLLPTQWSSGLGINCSQTFDR